MSIVGKFKICWYFVLQCCAPLTLKKCQLSRGQLKGYNCSGLRHSQRFDVAFRSEIQSNTFLIDSVIQRNWWGLIPALFDYHFSTFTSSMEQLPAHVMEQPAPATRHQQDEDDDRSMSPKPPVSTPLKSNSELLRTARQLKTASPMLNQELTNQVQKPLQPPLRTHPPWLLLLPWPPFLWPFSTRRWKSSTRTLWHDLIGTIAFCL